jgi:hypothetical protein
MAFSFPDEMIAHMRNRPAIVWLALLLTATPAWPQVPEPASPPASAPATAPASPRPANPDPSGDADCHPVCVPVVCPPGQICPPYCYQECM